MSGGGRLNLRCSGHHLHMEFPAMDTVKYATEVAMLSAPPALDADGWFELQLAARPESVRRARRAVMAQLARWGARESAIDASALVVSELVTNAVVYGAAPITLRLQRDAREVAIEVDDGSHALPRMLSPGADDLRGRGMVLVSQLSVRWSARRRAAGKTVAARIRID